MDRSLELIAELRALAQEICALRADLRVYRTSPIDAEAAALLDWLRDNVGTGTLFCASEIAPDLGYTDANELGRQLARLEHRGLIRAGRGQDGVLWLLSVQSVA